MSPVLEVKNLAKCYGRKNVLADVSFSLEQGRIVGIEGENGAGKSTLLKILVGMLPADKGEVRINGSLGYCPQETTVFNNLTVAENFYYFAGAYGLHESDNWQIRKNDLMHRFNFQHEAHTLVSKLSGGTRQKLNLALAILHAPDLLILDEPYAAFDWETYLHFWDYVGECREKGKNVLIVSHLIYDPTLIDERFRLKNGNLTCL